MSAYPKTKAFNNPLKPSLGQAEPEGGWGEAIPLFCVDSLVPVNCVILWSHNPKCLQGSLMQPGSVPKSGYQSEPLRRTSVSIATSLNDPSSFYTSYFTVAPTVRLPMYKF